MKRTRGHALLGGGVGTGDGALGRRRVMASSGLALVGVFSGVALARASEREAARARARQRAGLPEDRGQLKDHMERLRNAKSEEERRQILREFQARRNEAALARWKVRLGISDVEWPVIKPRLKAVYERVRGSGPAAGGSSEVRKAVEKRSKELRELLREKEAAVERIKAKVTALRAAQEKVRQELALARRDLRQLLTVRQEAELVLDGLLV